MNKILKSCLVFAVALQGGISRAQTEGPGKVSGGMGHFSFTAHQLGIASLNNLLASSGYGKISSTGIAYGGGGFFCHKNFLLGGEGAWLGNARSQSASNSVNMNGGYGFLNAGYLAWSGKRSILYPMIGIGGGGYSLLVSKKDPGEDFEQHLNAPTGMINTETGGWMLNAQLACHFFFSEKEKSGWAIGLKAGYRYSPSTWKMAVNGTELNNSPGINMNGFYATITLGGGGFLSH